MWIKTSRMWKLLIMIMLIQVGCSNANKKIENIKNDSAMENDVKPSKEEKI